MSKDYIQNNFSNILAYENAVENRLHCDVNLEKLIADNEINLQMCKKYELNYILIDAEYKVDIEL